MGKTIRRSVTITVTESWTIVWSSADAPLPSANTIVQADPTLQEEADEIRQTAVNNVEFGDPTVSDPILATASAVRHPHAAAVTTKPSASSQRRRRRRVGRNQRSKL
jgi:hypothetical protein